MKVLESALLILAALALPQIAAQDSSTAALCKENSNGCSVPFEWVPCQERFRPACDRHDTCYHCGEHFNFTREDCDNAFLTDMKAQCANDTDVCVEDRKRRETFSMSNTTPLRQQRLLEKLLLPSDLHAANCMEWAEDYFDVVRGFASAHYTAEADSSYCPRYADCMPQEL